jgi:hypothetical protein
MGAMPASPAASGLKEVKERAVEMAKKNADAAFSLANKISKSRDLQEILTLQTRFAQDQMQASPDRAGGRRRNSCPAFAEASCNKDSEHAIGERT